MAFLSSDSEETCMEYEPIRRNDDWAKETMKKLLGVSSGTSLQQMDRADRSAALKALKGAGLTVRQIERLTGINRNVVQKA